MCPNIPHRGKAPHGLSDFYPLSLAGYWGYGTPSGPKGANQPNPDHSAEVGLGPSWGAENTPYPGHDYVYENEGRR